MDKQAAIYARVSSEQQAEAQTIQSQLAALHERVRADGLRLPGDRQFVDEGYSGATLVRPGLEHLRDLVATGGVDRLYVHSPDRLARKYAYQALLIDEFERAGLEVIFLNRELGKTPEDALLLQVQGMMAEYERAKILERSRRGKRHAAHTGSVNVLCTAPYGYRYVDKHSGGGHAAFEIVVPEARVVQQVFDWVGRERLSIGEVTRRLSQSGEQTRTGKTWWDRTTIWGMLKNSAYKGVAAFGKTRVGPMRPRLRAQRGHALQPRRAYSIYDVPAEEWIGVPVPAIIDADLFAVVQEQLSENRCRARQRLRGARYLLQGLVTCKRCQYAYYGKPISPSTAHGKPRHYAYYRCIGTDAYRFGGQRVCNNKQVRTDILEEAVWREVRGVLQDPQRLQQEFQRRLQRPKKDPTATLQAQIGKLQQGIARLIDSYADGLLEKSEFEPRIKDMKQRIGKLQEQARRLTDETLRQTELRLIIRRLEDFAATLKDGLDHADWDTQRELIRLLVKGVEIDQDHVNVVFRVNPGPSASSPDRESLQHCGRSNLTVVSQPVFACVGHVLDGPLWPPGQTDPLR